jgi:hypothetical protein
MTTPTLSDSDLLALVVTEARRVGPPPADDAGAIAWEAYLDRTAAFGAFTLGAFVGAGRLDGGAA